MSASLGPFIMCFLAVIVLTAYISFIIYVKKDILYEGMKFTFGVIVLILIRMMVPFNFPFTVTVGITKVLPPLSRGLFYHINGTDLRLADILMVVWAVEATRRLFKMYRDDREYRRFLAPFRENNLSKYPVLKEMLEVYGVPDMPVYVVSAPISPELYGAWKSVLVIPRYAFSNQEMEFVCRHELEHYKNHDLWLKLFVELAVCIQWFNPFVYLLHNELILAYEMSNDNKVLKDCDENQRLAYGTCLYNISKLKEKDVIKQRGLTFTKGNSRNIKRRIQFVISKDYGKTKKNSFSVFLRYVIVVVIFVISLVFVPEAFGLKEAEEAGTIEITENNSYILKTDTKYLLYVNGEFLFALSSVPEEFIDLPIIEEED